MLNRMGAGGLCHIYATVMKIHQMGETDSTSDAILLVEDVLQEKSQTLKPEN